MSDTETLISELAQHLARETWVEWHGPMAKIPAGHDAAVESIAGMLERFDWRAASGITQAPATKPFVYLCNQGHRQIRHDDDEPAEAIKCDKCDATAVLCDEESQAEAAAPAPLCELIQAAEKLLEWVPPCSLGSSGDLRQKRLRAAIGKFGRDGSLNEAVGVKADLEHPGNDTGGETANASSSRSQAAREIAKHVEEETGFRMDPGYLEKIIAGAEPNGL